MSFDGSPSHDDSKKSNQATGILNELCFRFGNLSYFRDVFIQVNRTKTYDIFHELKKVNKYSLETKDHYRQHFLKILSDKNRDWLPVSASENPGCYISLLFHTGDNEYIAFLKLEPSSMKTETRVPENVTMLFHCIIGNVEVKHKCKTRELSITNFITIRPKICYSIRNICSDQASYLLFKVTKTSQPEEDD